ncbi:unnamed protein product [Dracunculus medinensis]|uniref:Uncharacterized protein n=1 Tax=Dracunculus medinensis TaxID=318479 RepID=A0A3P7SHA9_DRAME|nr:unnamed protein product [Dracunculus medinensis]
MKFFEKSDIIDIQCNKLLDWLISRRHCNKDWEKGVMDIRRRIGEAVQDMPEDEKVVDLLKGQYIHYFQCLKIIEILKETEKDSKNFLGFYSSQRMNDWLQICQMYEKDNIGLAEASQMLIRLVHYKIPDLKRRIQKCDQNLIICELKEKDYNKLAEEARRQYEKDLQKMGIKGKNINYEISELVMDLPKFFNEIAQEIYSLKDAIDYYDDFSRYLHELINSWLHQVQNLLRKLTDPQKSLLYKIRSSQHHLKMIAESFEHKFSLEERYKNLAQLTVSNQVGIRNARNILEAELNTMVESTRFLQKEIEKEISQKYNGRRVNIMGSVTAALSSV